MNRFMFLVFSLIFTGSVWGQELAEGPLQDRDGILNSVITNLKEVKEENQVLNSQVREWRRQSEDRQGVIEKLLEERDKDHKGLIKSFRDSIETSRLEREAERLERIEARKDRETFLKRLEGWTPGQNIAWRIFWCMVPVFLVVVILLLLAVWALSILLKVKKAVGI